MKKFLCGLFLCLFLAASGVALAGDNIRLIINGVEIKPDVSPTIINGRVLVPIRAIGETLGANVHWDEANRTVVVLSRPLNNVFAKEEVINFVKPATVKIITLSKERDIQGSGFNIDPTGLIVTSNHVVENARDIEVMFPDGLKYKANIKFADPQKDIALLKLSSPAVNLATIEMGDSDSVKQGDEVIAVGSPLGVAGTVAVGTVGNASVTVEGFLDPLMQLNINFNGGFSGGPVVNYTGKVVGIVTGQILEGGEPANKMSVAVPINLVKSMIKRFI